MKSWIRYALSTMVLIMLGSCFSGPYPPVSTQKESVSASRKGKSSAAKCQHLKGKPSKELWNHSTQQYMFGPEWGLCMGVRNE